MRSGLIAVGVLTFAVGIALARPGVQGWERPRPHRAEDLRIRGEVSAIARAGGGAPAQLNNADKPSGSPQSAESIYQSALTLEQHARFDEALAAMRDAVRLAPTSDLYLAALGDAAIKAGHLDEARRALTDLRHLAIDHDVVPARIRILAGDLQRAEMLAQARALRPGHPHR